MKMNTEFKSSKHVILRLPTKQHEIFHRPTRCSVVAGVWRPLNRSCFALSFRSSELLAPAMRDKCQSEQGHGGAAAIIIIIIINIFNVA